MPSFPLNKAWDINNFRTSVGICFCTGCTVNEILLQYTKHYCRFKLEGRTQNSDPEP